MGSHGSSLMQTQNGKTLSASSERALQTEDQRRALGQRFSADTEMDGHLMNGRESLHSPQTLTLRSGAHGRLEKC